MGHPIYHLDLQVKRCRVEVRINDFPVAELTSIDEQPATFAPPINPYLAGELNIVDVHLYPFYDDAGAPISFFDAEVLGVVRRYEKGDIVAPNEGPEVTTFTIPKELVDHVREEELDLPQSFTHVFSNDEIDFSSDLSGAPVVDDRDALVDYAIHLRDLTAASDVTGLLREFEPKLRTWVAAYDEPWDAFEESLQTELGEFIAEGPVIDFGPDAIELRRHCGGRIWELRAADRALLSTDELDDGSRSQFDIFVGMREGALRIVR